MTSRIPGFYRLPPADRLTALEARELLQSDDRQVYQGDGLSLEAADMMVENVVSTYGLPCAMAVNFLINDRDFIIPMVVEEPSVVAAVSHMAKIARAAGGFQADSDPSIMIGQVQLMEVRDPQACVERLTAALPDLEGIARSVHPRLVEHGGGFREFAIRTLTYDEPGEAVESMVVLHVHVDCADAMGANMVNTICERLAPAVGAVTGEQVGLRILTNLADHRLSRAKVAIPFHLLGANGMDGEEVARRIAAGWRFAWADPYRAATHNKGVMNGIDAVALATGNDWRAIEAGAHAWCCRDGQYRPVTRWSVRDGLLHGSIELPLQFGTVGGSIRLHPTTRANLNTLGVSGAPELASIAVAVGLAQNLGAMRALATEGIQCGHMRLHARNVAALVGASQDEVAHVSAQMVQEQDFSVEHAALVLERFRRG